MFVVVIDEGDDVFVVVGEVFECVGYWVFGGEVV